MPLSLSISAKKRAKILEKYSEMKTQKEQTDFSDFLEMVQ
jgi:hypothetical protein